MNCRCEADDDSPYSATDVVESEVLSAASVRVRAHVRRRVRLQYRPPLKQTGHSSRDHERPVGTDQRLGKGFDCSPLSSVRLRRICKVVLVRQVNDSLRLGRPAA
ncbi:hypothetical protein [Paenibacillus sp. HGF7]|uniref:hypothetical protein n=1 Tax=Paenibacillus sp. HGF7 TaxID=944559 RepID=UPI0032C4201E